MGLETRVGIVLELLSNAGVVSLFGPSGLLVLALAVLLVKGDRAQSREPGPVPAGPRTHLVCVAAVLVVLMLIAAV